MAKFATLDARIGIKPRLPHCGAYSLLYKDEAGYIVFPMRCKSWQCPYCAQKNSDIWAHRVSFQPCERFLTLTDLGETREDVNKRVTELFRRIRKLKINFEYWGMVELHKSGLPHWHSITHGDYIPPLVLKWLARESGIGHTDIRKITSGRGAAYYCTKHLGHAHGRRWSGRVVRYSRGFFVNDVPWQGEKMPLDEGSFEMVEGRAQFVYQTMKEKGYLVDISKIEPDYLIGDKIENGEIIKKAPRDMSRGYGVFSWKSKKVKFYEI